MSSKSETRPCYKRDCDKSKHWSCAHHRDTSRLKPDPAIKGIATARNDLPDRRSYTIGLKPDPAIKGIATFSQAFFADLKELFGLKPDPAIKGIATSPRSEDRIRSSQFGRSETRPCYKRDCDFLPATCTRASLSRLKPDPAIKGIATPENRGSGFWITVDLSLKPDPAIKGIATSIVSSPTLDPCSIIRLKPDPAIKGIATNENLNNLRSKSLFCLKPDPAIKGIATKSRETSDLSR